MDILATNCFNLAVVCGFPTGIANGYVSSVTSIKKDGVATYSCFAGFTLSGTPATCDGGGTWSSVPNCQG